MINCILCLKDLTISVLRCDRNIRDPFLYEIETPDFECICHDCIKKQNKKLS